MKIRNNYVSNSSSSSFILIGIESGNIFENLTLDFNNKNYVMIGRYFFNDEADDFIELTEEMFNWLNDRKYDIDIGNGTIIEVIKSGKNSWSSNRMKISDNLKNATVYLINASYRSSSSVEDLEKNYIKR